MKALVIFLLAVALYGLFLGAIYIAMHPESPSGTCLTVEWAIESGNYSEPRVVCGVELKETGGLDKR